MSRCFPFPPPGYDNEKKSSNGEIGHVHKKIKHKQKEKKEKKRKREDEVQANDLIEKKDKKHKKHKKHKHHKHKKDKRKGRHAEHDEDIKRTGVAHDSPTREETVFFNFVQRERPGTGSCNKVDISDSERSRQIKDELRDNGMGGNPKMDKVRDNSDCNVRKRKEMDTNFFVGPGDAEESFNKSETIGIKFVERERLGNGKCVKIDLSEREESRQYNCQTSDNGMEKDQKIGKDGGKSNSKVRKGKKIDTDSSSHGGNAQEIPKKREAFSIKFVDKERPCNDKCDKINLLNDHKSLTDGVDKYGIVRKGSEINTNSSLHGNRPWEHLPVLMDKVKQSTTHIQTTFAKEVYSDIGRTAQVATNLLVECISMSHVQNAGNHALGKSVDNTSSHPSSGRDKCSLRNFQSTFTKEAYLSTDRVAQEVKNVPVECIRKTKIEEASNASFDHCIGRTRCDPLFSGKEKQFKECHQAGSAEVHLDSRNKVQDAQGCAVGCIPGSKVQEVSNAHLEKCVASASQHPSTTVKQKGFNTRSQTASIEDFHSHSLRKKQDSKECAVECLHESRIQLTSNADLEKCVAIKNCHLSFCIKDKRSIKHPHTALSEKALFDGKRIGKEANGVSVDCKPGSRSQEASAATLQKGVTSTSCSTSFSGNGKGVTSTSCSPSFSGNGKGVTSTSCSPSFSGRDCERNGVTDCRTTSHFIGHLHGTTEAVDVSSRSRADCKTTSQFIGHSNGTTEAVDAVPSVVTANCKTTSHLIGPSYDAMEAVDVAPGSRVDRKASQFVGHGTTKAVDIAPSGSWADKHIPDLKYFPSLPQKQSFSDLDDQAWLFLSNGRKPNAKEKFDHASNVWDRLLVLQHNNTYALPYVTPF